MHALAYAQPRPLSFFFLLKVGIFDSVQATFNLLDQSAGPALGRAHASGMDVIVKVGVASPLFIVSFERAREIVLCCVADVN